MIRRIARARARLLLALLCAIGCGGASTPVTLAAGESSASQIAAIGGNVYWLHASVQGFPGSLRTIPATGGTAQTVSSLTLPMTLNLTSDSAIVGSANGDVYRVPLAGGPSSILIPKAVVSPVVAVAVSGDVVYSAQGAGALQSASLTTGTVQQLGSAAGAVTFLTSDGSYLYWGTSGGEISREPADGSGAAVMLGSIDGTNPMSPVFVGASFYFFSSTYVGAVDTTTGKVSVVIDSVSSGRTALDAWGLAGNGSSLFLGQLYGISRVNTSNGSSTIFISEEIPSTSLAVDSNNAYWIAASFDASGDPIAGNTIYRAKL